MLNLPRLAEKVKLKQNRSAREKKRSGRESARSVQWVSMEKSIVEKTWGRGVLSLEWKREGVIDGDNGGDDSVDPMCVGWWEGERPGPEDVDKDHEKNEGVYSKGRVLHVEKNGL